jgi:hypothetical protein
MPRAYLCYNDVIYGEIENVLVLDKKNTTLNKPKELFSICKSVPFRIEVVVNTCVDDLKSRIKGPLGSFTIPADKSKYPSRYVFHSLWFLLPGKYKLYFIPDGIESKSKSLEIELKKC